MHTMICECQVCCKFSCTGPFSPCTTQLLPQEPPTFFARSEYWFLWTHSISWYLTPFLATNDLASMLLTSLSAASQTMKTSLDVFPFNTVNCVNPCPCFRQISVTINVPTIVNTALLRYIQGRICCAGHIYFRCGLDNDSSFGTWSLTLGSTWWR